MTLQLMIHYVIFEVFVNLKLMFIYLIRIYEHNQVRTKPKYVGRLP